jgi:hypothetical protein
VVVMSIFSSHVSACKSNRSYSLFDHYNLSLVQMYLDSKICLEISYYRQALVVRGSMFI